MWEVCLRHRQRIILNWRARHGTIFIHHLLIFIFYFFFKKTLLHQWIVSKYNTHSLQRGFFHSKKINLSYVCVGIGAPKLLIRSYLEVYLANFYALQWTDCDMVGITCEFFILRTVERITWTELDFRFTRFLKLLETLLKMS